MSKNTQPLATAEEIAKAYNLPSVYTVNEMRRKRKIPALKLGYRTFRFELEAVGLALRKLEVRAI